MSPALPMGRSYEQYSTLLGKMNETPLGKNIATSLGNIASRCMDSSRTASSTPSGLKTFNLINKSVNTYSNCANPAHSFTCNFDFSHEHELNKVRSGIGQNMTTRDNTGTLKDIPNGISGDTYRTTLSVNTHIGHSHQDMTDKYTAHSTVLGYGDTCGDKQECKDRHTSGPPQKGHISSSNLPPY